MVAVAVDKHPLKILVTGARGLIGSSLVPFLEEKGCIVSRLPCEEIDKGNLDGYEVVVHLCGRSIQSRWTKKVKKEIWESREGTTKRLADRLACLKEPPKLFLAASGLGYYGDCGDSLIDERHGKGGRFFLADVCEAWENAAASLPAYGIRVAHLRFGAVLSAKKGALYEMLKVFRMGFGSVLGNGSQYFSWIAIDDAVQAIHHTILHEELKGGINVTSPYPLVNRDFNKKLANYLNKHLGPNIHPWILRFLKGQMADEVLLSSIRAYPKKLIESGYEFSYPHLDEALSHLIRQ